jgi:hypothetical protein
MKNLHALCVAFPLLGALSISAADSKSEVDSAIKSLSGKGSYSWKSTTTVPESSRMRMGPTEGCIQPDGLARITMTMGENKTEAIVKGENSVILGQDGTWQKPSEMADAQGQGRGRAMFARNFRAPATQAAEILGFVKEIKKEGDAYSGDLTEDGAKQLMTFRRGSTGDGPSITDAKGTAKFWIKDGVLSKYETHVEGKISFNGNDREVNRTTTVELKDVGSTKVKVPEEALKKLS